VQVAAIPGKSDRAGALTELKSWRQSDADKSITKTFDTFAAA
jgi:hypothetical protein